MSDEAITVHQPCDDCGSSDALSVYEDHTYCFSCGKHTFTNGHEPTRSSTKEGNKKNSDLVRDGEHRDLKARRIFEATCQRFHYTVGTYAGKTVQIAPYYNEAGALVAQKLRFPDKTFMFLGDTSEATLFGQKLWKDGGKRVVITEGEIDALSYAQATNLSWPVVSVPSGAKGARKAIKKSIAWLEKFDEVVFLFDNDEPGREAALECADVLTPGKAKIAELPRKDANDMLKAGEIQELLKAVWNAKTYRPDGIVSLGDLRERVLKPVEWGLPWPWQTLTELTYGRRYGEIYGFGGATGGGKSTVFDIVGVQTALPKEYGGLNEACAFFYLERNPVETGKRLSGQVAKKLFHVPDAGWTQEELLSAWDKLTATNNIYLYDHFGSTDWEIIKSRIRFLAHAHDVKHVFLDHLTALADPSNERESLEVLMKEMAALAQNLNICIYFVSHLATPEGKPHEEGGRVMIRHFKGSRAIGFWSFFMFGLERDQQSEDEDERLTTTFRVLKDRYTGQATGHVFRLKYDLATGTLIETTAVANDFDDEDDDELPPWEGDEKKPSLKEEGANDF